MKARVTKGLLSTLWVLGLLLWTLVMVGVLLLGSVPALYGANPGDGRSLAEARQALEQQLISTPGFAGIAHSEERGEIVVFLENEQVSRTISSRFDRFAVRTEVTGRIHALSSQLAEPMVLGQAHQISPDRARVVRPLMGGTSVSAYVAGPAWSGTLGMVTYDNKILSNAHVIAMDLDNNFLPEGTPIVQPAGGDGGGLDNQVGALENYITITFSPFNTPDPVVNYADAAIATIDPAIEGLSGWQFGDAGDYQVSGTTTVTAGDTVRKSGLTTGVTTGEVVYTDVNVWVWHGHQSAYFADQIAVQPFSQQGDSGSAVDKDGEFLGLVHAGSYVYSIVCKASYIIDGLGIAFADPVRTLPATVAPGEEFEVTVTFTAPCDDYRPGFTDSAPTGWTVSVDPEWCEPEPFDGATPEPNRAEYVWATAQDEGVDYTVVYKVQVPSDAEPGVYDFSGARGGYCGTAEQDRQPIGGDYTITVVDVAIQGQTREVNCEILPYVTVTLYDEDGVPVASTTSNEDGEYSLGVPGFGDYELVASKEGLRPETKSVSVTGPTTTVDFIADHGLIPDDPDVFYVLDCIILWQYPEPPCALDVFRVMDVIIAWQYPISSE